MSKESKEIRQIPTPSPYTIIVNYVTIIVIYNNICASRCKHIYRKRY